MNCQIVNLQREYKKKKLELLTQVETVYGQVKCKMDAYFDESPEQETIAKWRLNIENKLKQLEVKLQKHAADTCNKLFMSRNSRAKADSKIENLGSEIMKHVQQVAPRLKGVSLTEEELKDRLKNAGMDGSLN